MGYRCSFLDNEIYGADDVSEAFSRLITGGVRTVFDGENIVDALNDLTQEAVLEGTRSYSDLEVTMADGIITIGEGVGFFESGVSVSIDSEGICLEKGERTAGYVSIFYDADLNKVLPQITDAVPTGDLLLLARFEDDTVYDMRSYARAKLFVNCANNYHDFTISMSSFSGYSVTSPGSTATYKMPHTGFKYMLLKDATCSQLTFSKNDTIIDISEEGTQKFTLNRSSPLAELVVERTGDELSFKAYYANMQFPQTYELTLV